MLTRSDWATELAEVQLKFGGAGFGVYFERLYAVTNVAFMREALQAWNVWAAEERQVGALFNWIAVFNVNRQPNVHAFALGTRDVQALMLVRDNHIVQCDGFHRPPVVYVSFLEVAPWNRLAAPNRPRIRGAGTAMLRIAADLAMQHGHDGRVGLHSVSVAEGFYRRLGFQSLDCPNEYHEMYFELDESGAQALMRD